MTDEFAAANEKSFTALFAQRNGAGYARRVPSTWRGVPLAGPWDGRRVVPPGQFPDNNLAMSLRELGSVGWALAPLVTVGLAAGPCFAYAALRLRSRALGLAAIGYTALSALVVWGADWNNDSVGVNAGALAVLLLWGVSTAHALTVRRTVFFGQPPEDAAIAAARDQIRRRDESRRIAATDQRLARELQIGRPDRPSRYDDGGLVDVNHVPAECLSALGTIDGDLAQRIVDTRRHVGGFDGRGDLEAVMGLDPRALDEVADRLIFCR